jgi:hypothetical protein
MLTSQLLLPEFLLPLPKLFHLMHNIHKRVEHIQFQSPLPHLRISLNKLHYLRLIAKTVLKRFKRPL